MGSVGTDDPPSRLTQPAMRNSENLATLGSTAAAEAEMVDPSTGEEDLSGIWRPRRGGVENFVACIYIRFGSLPRMTARDYCLLQTTSVDLENCIVSD